MTSTHHHLEGNPSPAATRALLSPHWSAIGPHLNARCQGSRGAETGCSPLGAVPVIRHVGCLSGSAHVLLTKITKGGTLTRTSPRACLSHGCSNSISALGRSAGFFLKHCVRKSRISSLHASGIGGDSSSTIRYMTGWKRPPCQFCQFKVLGEGVDSGQANKILTGHPVMNFVIRWMTCQELNRGTGQ